MGGTTPAPNEITLFLCGDVMTGRGIDQILPHPGSPELHEAYVTDARDYVHLAERINGHIAEPRGFGYVWGEALEELAQFDPDLRIVNLETAVTRSDDWEAKGINYRMHPDNLPCLTAAGIDCCVLANNHVLDWGPAGLQETLSSLHDAGIRTAGAGSNRAEALAPAVLPVPGKGRVLVFAFGCEDSGVSRQWAAQKGRPGVAVLDSLSEGVAQDITATVRRTRQPGDVVVVSLHWGGNWGYGIPAAQTRFAHALIDAGAADVIHGHSSHHVKGMEIYRRRAILYGCGDLLSDYEGISGYEAYRDDLGLMYFPTLDADSGALLRLHASPTRIHRFRLQRALPDEAKWLADVLARESASLGVRVILGHDGRLHVHEAR